MEICVERVSTNLSIGMLVIWQISFYFIYEPANFPWQQTKDNQAPTPDRLLPLATPTPITTISSIHPALRRLF